MENIFILNHPTIFNLIISYYKTWNIIIIVNAFGLLDFAKRFQQHLFQEYGWSIHIQVDNTKELESFGITLHQDHVHSSSNPPDFILCLRDPIFRHSFQRIPHYVYTANVEADWYQSHRDILVRKMSGLLTSSSSTSPSLTLLSSSSLLLSQKTLYNWYLLSTCNKNINSNQTKSINDNQPFHDINNRKKKIFFASCLWDNKRSSPFYQQVFRFLDQYGSCEFYGPKNKWERLSFESYKGLISFDGHSLVKKMSDCGIALLIFNYRTLQTGVASIRIFEALSSGAIIIAEPHPFIVKHFGDNVLYIKSCNNMQQQLEEEPITIASHIQQCYHWILQNPKQCQTMIFNCQEIVQQQCLTIDHTIYQLFYFHFMSLTNNDRDNNNVVICRKKK